MKLERILRAKRISFWHGVFSGFFAGFSCILLYINAGHYYTLTSCFFFGYFVASHYYNSRLIDLYYSLMESEAIVEQLLNKVEDHEIWDNVARQLQDEKV